MIKLTACSPAQFQEKLLAWFDQKGRKNLPWQQHKSPYWVWVSEIMLQQTQVTTVIPYFIRFIERFPDVNTLASASEDEVLHLWTGLGYYNRARNLHETAKQIKQLNYFPNTLFELEQLRGIGRSTAGAILAIAFEKQATILDGNVKRVLSRLTAIQQWPGEKEVQNDLWQLAELLTPTTRVAAYTQAIMDLGATLCTRSKPHCEACPFEKTCCARQLGVEKTLPIAKPKKSLPIKQATLLIFQYKNRVLLQKRSDRGVWKGLWSLPELPKQQSLNQIQHYLKKNFSFSIGTIQSKESFRHTFSHYHLDIFPVRIPVLKKSELLKLDTMWYNLSKPALIGLPAPIKHLITHLKK